MKHPIHLQSEPNPPSGTITAEGLLNTMGRPKLSATEMLIRESLQNSWDAGRIEVFNPISPFAFHACPRADGGLRQVLLGSPDR